MKEQLNTGLCSLPKAYLLTGYVNRGEPISKLSPLFNRVVVADSNEATPILLSSDEGAVLEAVDGKQSTTRAPFHAHKTILLKLSNAASTTNLNRTIKDCQCH
ncbi:hypothetical protein I6F66_19725 [Pseudoalteromonas sp. NZS100_1]|uniref:hypothetical protein n=1 Tax=Pseudoalteromonas sp. NZS100_1 TaxID=2792073 RepID=UPI0018CECD93|nr:hypothetical protein [Pseudoalteromonas sp. NZS100_1]MBH0014303.1 hypothetical protein [Pseudoalteromonas sp. NZS100_1]